MDLTHETKFKPKPWILGLIAGAFLSTPSLQASSNVANPLFFHAHTLPSPFTLPAGKTIVGSITALGITDYLDVETNLFSDFYQIFNARIRFSILDLPTLAAGIYIGVQSANLNAFYSTNPAVWLNSWMPGAVVSTELMPRVALFVGGNLFFSDRDLSTLRFSTAGFLQGGQIASDISWAYSPKAEKTGNVLSAGLSFNFSYSLFGMGISHHWPGFHMGVHYYPGATTLRVAPILSGGATFDL